MGGASDPWGNQSPGHLDPHFDDHEIPKFGQSPAATNS